MAIKLTSKPNTEPADITYPFGNIKDRSGAVPGTPVDVEVYADFHQFFEMLMNMAEISHNDLPDNSSNGYQFFDAFARFANGSALIDTYTVTQSGTSAPVVDGSRAGLIGITGTSPSRLSAGEYQITFPGGILSGLASPPSALQLIVSAGSPLIAANATINCRMENSRIRISTAVSGTPTDGILDNYCFSFKFFPQALY